MKLLSARPTVRPIIIAGYGFLSGAMVMCGIMLANHNPWWLSGTIWFAGCFLLCYTLSLKVHQ